MGNALDLGIQLVVESIFDFWCGGKGWGIGTNDVDVPGGAEEAEGDDPLCSVCRSVH